MELGTFEPVADQVHVAVGEPASVNIGLVVGSAGALLIDTGSSVAQGCEIRAAAARVAGDVPLVGVVVTHPHYDHWYGLGAFEGVPSWGHLGFVAAARHPAVVAEARAAGVSADHGCVPTQQFSLAKLIDLGDCHAELLHFGAGHTAADVVVNVPAREVVFAGDLVESTGFPVLGPDSVPSEWPATLDRVIAVVGAETSVVPGHGDPMSRAEVIEQRSEIARLDHELRRCWDARVPADQVAGEVDDWPMPAAQAAEWVRVRYAQFTAERRPRPLPLLGGR